MMCIIKPECQLCETCGLKKYQLWASEEMHDRGCPWGFQRMDACPDAVNAAKRSFFLREETEIQISEKSNALIAQMQAAGVDLSKPEVDFEP